jgi:rhamnosyltransferase
LKDNILISVVIPVKNGDYWLEDTLTSIEQQTLFHCTEIIAIDSGSTDRSIEILTKHEVRLIKIAPDSFNHGLTRNLGVEAALGEFVVMTVQDAKPVDQYWLQNLLDGFEDEKVVGVCGQQVVPHDLDKNPVEWFRPQSPPSKTKHYFQNPEGFEKLSPAEKRSVCGWDNVTAMYRKKLLLEIPFRETSFAEDALWAKDALLKGYSIVYNTAARVFHYHLSEPQFVIRRSFTVYYHFFKFFGHKPSRVRNDIKSILKNLKLLLSIKQLSLTDKYRWLSYNWRLRANINKSVDLFLKYSTQGDATLIQKHDELCSVVPAAVKPKIK